MWHGSYGLVRCVGLGSVMFWQSRNVMASPGEARRVDVGSAMVRQGSQGKLGIVGVGFVCLGTSRQLWHGESRLVIAGRCGVRFGSQGSLS